MGLKGTQTKKDFYETKNKTSRGDKQGSFDKQEIMGNYGKYIGNIGKYIIGNIQTSYKLWETYRKIIWDIR